MYIRIYVCVHTHIHTFIHTFIHIYIHAYTQIHISWIYFGVPTAASPGLGQVRGGVLPKSEFYANYGVLYDVVLISIYYI